jgi:hypothetical protein
MSIANELKQVIGKDVSQNQSPTCRARLVKVNKVYKVPNWIAWNSFFF